MSPLRAACRLVLALYPEGWRARYGPEIDEALEHRGVTPFTLLDLAASALYAHRHPELAPTEVLSMSARQRSSVISVLAATIVFAVGWAAVLSVRDPLPPWLAAADRHPDLRLAVGAVQAAGALAILAVLAGGLVLLGSASLRGGEAAGRSARGLGLAGVAFAGFIALLAAAGLGLVTPLNAAIGTGPASLVWGVALLACVAVGVIGSARAVRQAAPDPTALRVALLIGQVGAAAMALAALGGLWLALAVSAEASDIGAPLLPVIVLTVAAGWTGAALRRVGALAWKR